MSHFSLQLSHIKQGIWTKSARYFFRGKNTLSLEHSLCIDTRMHTLPLTHRFFQARLPCIIKGNVYQALITKLLGSSEWCTIIRQAAQISSCHKAALPPISFNNLYPGPRWSINYACIPIHLPYVWMIACVPYHEGYGAEDLRVKGTQPPALLRGMPWPTC